MAAEIENQPVWPHEDDSLISALAASLAENDLPFERVSASHLRLPVQGNWQRYDVSITQAANAGDVHIECRIMLDGVADAADKLYPLLMEMNNSSTCGRYCVDMAKGWVGYRLSIPSLLLGALDIFILEELVDDVLLATENLFPVCQSLIKGKQSLETALGKYIHQPQGHA